MKKSIFSHSIAPWKIFSLLLGILLLLMIPIFAIARYDVPAADDFSFSCETHAAIVSGGSLTDILSGAVEKAVKVYYTWQGTFSAIFLMAFQPAIWGLPYYAFTTWIMVLSLLGGLFFFFHRVMHGVFGISKSLAGITAIVASVACTQFLPSPNQSFYWYNGAVYYTFTFAIMLVLFAIVIGYLLYGSWWRIAGAVFLCLIIGGSNYVTALFTSIAGILLLALLTWKKDRNGMALLLPYVVLLGAFLLSIRAPGNAVRQGFYTDHPGALEAILLSFRSALKKIFEWADLRYASCMIFLIPILWAGTGESQFSFPFPGVVSVVSFCLFSSLFTPHLYALGSDGPERLLNILYFSFLLLSILNLFWWIGWVVKKKRPRSTTCGISIGVFGIFTVCAVLCVACSVILFQGTLTSVASFSELRNREAERYYAQAQERQRILENPEIDDCEFEPFSTMPYILYFTDMTDDPDSYENQDTATFYGKHSIVVK